MGERAEASTAPVLRRVLKSLWADEPDLAGHVEPVAIVGLATREHDEVALLDASFFGTTGEALTPRARACLELGWEALEDAGIAGPSGMGGVFVEQSDAGGPLQEILGLTGPMIHAGTGLLALHRAAASLRDGDIDLALVLGRIDSRGLAGLVLRRMKDAVRLHDRVLDVILASGAAAAEVRPAALIRRLGRRAGLGSEDALSLPGTGLTALVQAVRARQGSAGTLGFLGESGEHGVVQVLLDTPAAAAAWARAELAPSGNFEPVSARPPSSTPIPSPLRGKGRTPVSRKRSDSPQASAPRNLGSSYTAPIEEPTPAGRQTIGVAHDLDGSAHLLLISARSRAALRARAEQIGRTLAEGADPVRVAATLAHRRVHFEHRLFTQANELTTHPVAGRGWSGLRHTVHGVSEAARPVAFLFTGEGTHREHMAVDLYDTEPVFRDTLNRCDALLRHHMERPLLTVLFPREERRELQDVVYAHPALFSLQFALTELWRYWGVVPSAVLGYGVGEYVAAVVAGVMRLEDAVALVAARARLVAEHAAPDGALAVVGASERLVRSMLERVGGKVSLAAVNSADEVLVGGHRVDVEAFLAELAASGIAGRPLDTRYGFNSPHVDEALEPFEHVARLPAMSLPRITYVSGSTGEIEATALIGARYWRTQLREPVRFSAALQTLLEAGWDRMVEVGPRPHLARVVARTRADAVVVPSMDRERNDHDVMLESLGRLWLEGCQIDWSLRYGRREPVSVPAYPWQRGVEEPVSDNLVGDPGGYDEPDSFAIDLPPLPAEPTPAFAADDVPEPSRLAPRGLQDELEELDPVALEPLDDAPVAVASEEPVAAEVPEEVARSAAAEVSDGVAAEKGVGATVAEGGAETAVASQDPVPTSVPEAVVAEDSAATELSEGLASEGPVATEIATPAAVASQDPVPASVPEAVASEDSAAMAPELAESAPKIAEEAATPAAIPSDDPVPASVPEAVASEDSAAAELSEGFASEGPVATEVIASQDPVLPSVPEAVASEDFAATELSEGFASEGPVVTEVIASEDPVPASVPEAVAADDSAAAELSEGIATAGPVATEVTEEAATPAAIPSDDRAPASVSEAVAPEVSDGVAWEDPDPAEVLEAAAVETVDLVSPAEASATDIDGAASAPAVFELAWRPLDPAGIDDPEQATWIVLTDAEGIGDYVAARLTDLGHTVVRVRPEPAYARADGTLFVADPADPSAWSSLVQQLKGVEGPIRVLHLWTLDVLDDEQPDALQKAQVLGPAALVHLKASLTAADREASVWVVTRGAAPLSEEAGTVTSAATWGAARAAWPSSGWIDLDPADEDPDALLANVLADDGETRVILRDGQRFGARLARISGAPTAPEMTADGTWLLVAPFDVGLLLGRWLVEQGARRLVFVPPTRPDGSGVQAMIALQKRGAKPILVPTDARRPSDVDRLVRRLEHEPPVVGVILAPGSQGSDAWPSVRDELAQVELGWTLHREVAGAAEHFVVLLPPDALLGGAMASGSVGAGLAGLARHRVVSGGAGRVAWWESSAEQRGTDGLERLLVGGAVELAILAPGTVALPLGRLLEELTSD